MDEQARLRRGRGRVVRKVLYGVLAVCGVLAAGAAGYAATGGWDDLVRVFSIKSDGTVTDESGGTVGTTSENEDGSFTARISTGGDRTYEIRTDEPLYGEKVHMEFVAPPPSQGK